MNPRCFRTSDFESDTIGHSDTPPEHRFIDSSDRDEARVFALAAALKDSPFVTNLPSDQELLALLRRALS